MSTKITDLQNGMINVVIEGTVPRKSSLSQGKNSKYFSFYLYDAEGHFVRVVAFKLAAEKLFDKFEEQKTYEISKVSVRENRFNNQTELQIVLTTDVVVTLKPNIVRSINFMPLSTLKDTKQTVVDVIGRIINVNETDRVLKDGTVKTVVIVSIMDEHVHVDVTFWEHVSLITAISEEERNSSVISIQGASLNSYQNAVSLNVGKSSVVDVNPNCEAAVALRAIDHDTAAMNLSQRSEDSAAQSEFSNEKMISAIKRELTKIEKKEERLKIKKIVFENELRIYESK